MYFGSPPFDQTELQPVNLTAGCFGNETSISECSLFDVNEGEEVVECLFAYVLCQRMLL